jgi:hypothetical protein
MIRPLAFAALLFTTAACTAGQATDVPNYLGMPHASTTPESDEEPAAAAHCGAERWPVKTGSDPDVGQINRTPMITTITAFTALLVPRALPPNHRAGPVELTTYTVHATVTSFKLEADSDYHLVLSDANRTMIAELPAPACVAPGPLRARIVAVRREFDARYHPGPGFQHVNVPVTITGVGFFDSIHGQVGGAVNGIELHPVLNITFSPAPPLPF